MTPIFCIWSYVELGDYSRIGQKSKVYKLVRHGTQDAASSKNYFIQSVYILHTFPILQDGMTI